MLQHAASGCFSTWPSVSGNDCPAVATRKCGNKCLVKPCLLSVSSAVACFAGCVPGGLLPASHWIIFQLCIVTSS